MYRGESDISSSIEDLFCNKKKPQESDILLATYYLNYELYNKDQSLHAKSRLSITARGEKNLRASLI